MSDNKWDDLLNAYEGSKPSDAQISKWKSAALNAKINFQKDKLNRKANWGSVVAATVVGILIGATLTMSLQTKGSGELAADINEEFATIEHVYTKTN